MQDQTIVCPQCGATIPLSETLSKQIEDSLHKQYKDQFEKDKKLFEEKQKSELWIKAQKAAQDKVALELKDLVEDKKEKEQLLKDFETRELELRKQKREIEEMQRKMRLDMERQIDELQIKIVSEAKKEADQEYRLKMLEKDKQMDQMTKTIQDLKRQAEQGSMQVQGDAIESDLKVLLQTNFPSDSIDDVSTGIRGADIIQTVKSRFGEASGIILWECKNTKGFSNEWVKKLKDDQIVAKADISILVTRTLPEGMEHFGTLDGIHIVNIQYILPLIHILRNNLVTMAKMKQSMEGSDSKMKDLYTFIHSSEFANKMQSIISPYISMKQDLESEKRVMNRNWSKREKELDRVIRNASSLYGDLEGVTAHSLPKVPSLELDSGNETESNSDEQVDLF